MNSLEITTRIELVERTEKLFNTNFDAVTYPSGSNVETLMNSKWINANDLLSILWDKSNDDTKIVNHLIVMIEKANANTEVKDDDK